MVRMEVEREGRWRQPPMLESDQKVHFSFEMVSQNVPTRPDVVALLMRPGHFDRLLRGRLNLRDAV